MTTTLAPPDRSLQQRRDAIEIANRIRSERAAIKRRIASMPKAESRLAAAIIIRNNDALTETMRVKELLLTCRGIGPWRARRILDIAEVSALRTIGGLTDRQRFAIETQLIGAKVD